MRYRVLGKTGLKVSEIGYGGGRVRAESDRAALVAMLREAFDVGLNYVDTASTYGGGLSEEVIGEAMSGRREGIVVATKTKSRDPKEIPTEVEGSLRRLQTDVIDVLQFHGGWWTNEDADAVLMCGGVEAYERLRDQGKVRYLGFSADGPTGATERLVESGRFDMIQTHFSLMYQSTCDGFNHEGLIPLAESHDMGIVLMRCTTSGAFPRIMEAAFPGQFEGIEWEPFLLNVALSNPLVDTALMSLASRDAVAWTNAVSDDESARLDIRALHRA